MSKPFTPYPNAGKLMARKNAKGKEPQYAGELCIGEDMADYIAQEYKAGRDIMIELAGWKKTSQAGNVYVSLAVKQPYVKTAGREKAKPADQPEVDVPF